MTDIERHTKEIHGDERAFKCSVCQKTFKRRDHLRTHTVIHSDEKPLKCPHCDKGFKHQCNLTVHIRTHTGELPFTRSYCQKGFNNLSDCKKHTKAVHAGMKDHKCAECGPSFASKGNLRSHILNHRDKTVPCELCPLKFKRKYDLYKHVASVHDNDDRSYVCTVCGKN